MSTVVISSGVTSSGLVVSSDAQVEVLSGGVASGFTVASGGILQLDQGGSAYQPSVQPGGVVLGPGTADGIFLVSGTVSGVLLSSVSGGVIMAVESGGLAVDDTVISGEIELDFLASVSGLVIGQSGLLDAQTLSVASNVQVESGGRAFFLAGALGKDVVISSGGIVQVENSVISAETVVLQAVQTATTSFEGFTALSGGQLQLGFVTVSSGGVLVIDSGAVASILDLESGAEVRGPGLISAYSDNFIVEGELNGVTLEVTATLLSGGSAVDTTVGAGGELDLDQGGTATNTTVLSNGRLQLALGGTAVGVTLSGGQESIAGYASGLVASSGTVTLASGGQLSAATFGSGATLAIYAGVASDVSLGQGAVLQTGPGGLASNVTLSSGAVMDAGLIVASGQTLTLPASPLVSSTLTISGVTLLSGASFYVNSAIVNSGGVLQAGQLSGWIYDYGAMLGGVVDAYFASVTIASGALASGVTFDGGSTLIASGGVLTGAMVSGGLVDISGQAFDTTLTHGSETVMGGQSGLVILGGSVTDDGGTIDGFTVQSGGVLIDLLGSIQNGVVAAGGSAVLYSGGHTGAGVSIDSGGVLLLEGGSASGAVVSSGGVFDISNLTVSSGEAAVLGIQSAAVTVDGALLLSGATLSADRVTIQSGGSAQLPSGAVIHGATVSSGAELWGPGVLSATGDFTSTQIYGVLSGVVVSGVGPVFSVDLPVYVEPGGSAVDVTLVSGAMLVVHSGGSASGAVVQSGASEESEGGGVVSGAAILSGGAEELLAGASASDVTVNPGGTLLLYGAASVSGLVLDNGSIIRLQVQGATNPSFSISGNELIVSSGGKVIDALGLAGDAAALRLTSASGSRGAVLVQIQATPNDFYGAGTSEVLWQDLSTGAAYEWAMWGGQHIVAQDAEIGLLPGWSDVGNGYFNGPGTAGILWQNASTGDVWAWTMSGGQQVGATYLGALAGWTAAGIGDFTGGGTSDILWQNNATGEVWDWTMSGGVQAGAAYLGTLPGWQATTGYFDGPGAEGIVWQNSATGAAYEWTMSGGQHLASQDVSLGTLQGWSIVGVGDFTGDGTSDILWQQGSTGVVWEWQMSQGKQTGAVFLGDLAGWQVAGVGNYGANGQEGILWRNAFTGATYEWTMSGGQHLAGADIYLGTLPASNWKAS